MIDACSAVAASDTVAMSARMGRRRNGTDNSIARFPQDTGVKSKMLENAPTPLTFAPQMPEVTDVPLSESVRLRLTGCANSHESAYEIYPK
jgi:hypothetical protein